MKSPTENGLYWLCMSPELIGVFPNAFEPVELHDGKVYKIGIKQGMLVEGGWQWGGRLRDLAESHARLIEALDYYRSQFGQALEAHQIPFGDAQREADAQARAALSSAKALASQP